MSFMWCLALWTWVGEPDLLGRALQALGGEEALSQLTCIHVSGQVSSSGLEGRYQLWLEAPDRLKTLLDFELIRIETLCQGDEGWTRQAGIWRALEGDALDQARRSHLSFPLLAYARRGIRGRSLGAKEIEGRRYWGLEFQEGEDRKNQFWLEAETYLPHMEVRWQGDQETKITYDDYRVVAGCMVPFSERRDTPQRLVQITLDQVEVVERFAPGFFEHPDQRYADQPFGIGLMTVPRTIYKENDGLFGSINQESWFFHVVVSETYGRSLTPTHASLKYYSGEELLETRTLNKPSLSGLSGVRFATAAGLDEVFDLRFQCSFMTEPPVDKMQVDLTLVAHDGTTLNESLEVTLSRYEPKTELWFPLEGYFVILAGGDFNEHHAQEWSQHHALDILALGPDRQLVSGYAATNQDFVSWGREVLAPADGVVVYTRNDVPDNANPPRVDKESLNKLPDPLWRVGGNSVVIDHGNGEFSFLAHMQQGSVRVAMGEVVKRGQVLGLLGNSGNSSAPHLHYHLMAGDTLFRSDPIPLRFKNVFFDGVAKGFATGPLKRGVYLRANWQ